MKFDLIRPCKDCPFRSDRPAYLSADSVESICTAMIEEQRTFSCHKTNVPSEDGIEMLETKDSQHCAGALIFLERLEQPNQMMRWMERLGAYDRTKLDMDSPVFETMEDMMEAQPS